MIRVSERSITVVMGTTLGVIAAVVMIAGFTPSPAPARVMATCPAEPSDAWIQRRIGYCDRICVGAPFVADVTEARTSCDCQRPERLAVTPLRAGRKHPAIPKSRLDTLGSEREKQPSEGL